MKLLIFTEGTILMHKTAAGKARKDIVRQVRYKYLSVKNYLSVKDYANCIPIGNAVKKLQKWKRQGIEIVYLTSRRKPHEISEIKQVLRKYNFPEGKLEFRKKGETYADVAERIKPGVLIEDDCESIGGTKEMTITNVKPNIKKKIKSIVVKEFEGIDSLPESFTKFK